jgi:hypothetical protein
MTGVPQGAPVFVSGHARRGLENDADSRILPGLTISGKLSMAGAAMLLLGLVPTRAAAQTPTTGSAFWPVVELHAQLHDNLRFLVLGELKNGEDYSYDQWRLGAALGYQMKSFVRPHLEDIDPQREHKLLFGAGYEYIESTESSRPGTENRVTLGITPRGRFPGGLLVSDRNRFEFRWVNGVYSNRYRNELGIERGTVVKHVHFTPYATAEFFYDLADGSWNQEQYAVGISWPFERVLKVNTYYLYQVCTTCNPKYLNVAGVTLNYFYRN